MARIGRKSGSWCCRVGESGLGWRPSTDRSGGAPPTPPLGLTLLGTCKLAFRGHFEHSLDAKNRLSIPALFARPSRTERFSPRTPSPAWRSGPPTREAIIERALGELNPMGSEYRKLSRFYQGNSFEIELDASGRVTLPAPLLGTRDREGGRGRGCRRSPRGLGAERGAQGGLDAEIGEVTERLGHPSDMTPVHVPVLAGELIDLTAPAGARRPSTAPSARGATRGWWPTGSARPAR